MRDPISCVGHFATAIKLDPATTLKTTAKGLAHVGELDGIRKVTVPAIGIAGVGLMFASAASGAPASFLLGGAAATHSAAMLFEHGEEVIARENGGGSPPTPPPV